MTPSAFPHPDPDALQAFAGGELVADEARQVEQHLADCARCRARVEAWGVLFGQLGELPRLTPSRSFRDRVMAEVEVPGPEAAPSPASEPERRRRWAARLAGWIRAVLPGQPQGEAPGEDGTPARPRPGDRTPPRAGRHPAPDRIQGWLDGSLSPALVRRVEAHVADCAACEGTVREWQPLLARLDGLGHVLAPAGLAEAVMARVDVAAVARRARARRRSLPQRVLGLLDRLRPSTGRGWLVAGGLGAVPTAAVAAALVTITAHPLLSVGGLLTLARWRLAEWALGSGEAALGHLASVGAGFVVPLLQTVSAAPGLVMAGVLALALGSALSTWVLFRTLPLPSLVRSRHEQRPS